jgi:hypothetical protein
LISARYKYLRTLIASQMTARRTRTSKRWRSTDGALLQARLLNQRSGSTGDTLQNKWQP